MDSLCGKSYSQYFKHTHTLFGLYLHFTISYLDLNEKKVKQGINSAFAPRELSAKSGQQTH